ncbi:TRAP transporter large permease [Rhizobium halophytocola]|uniref:TRAP transporter large permease protein n=1 Tax=Rhizobium halophytocola TaxID=735519 RepID=A0ABS4E627_9HYPH|nr:TRAP transporter large permease [Rhizobium halophytocola]MBP1853407.1 tripartite ATP-independent transporter DctM subunit [Rhizobium halophytocola]
MATILLFVTFIACLIVGVPVAVTLGLSSFVYMVLSGIPIVAIPQKMYAGMDVFVLLCIPGFILAGNLMNGGGITERIIRFASALVGWIRGGLGLTNIAGSMLFAGISGTAVADAASIGSVMIPGMKRAGYSGAFAAALTAAASTVGPIIPPSVPMIIVGSLTGVSVGRMFMAGAIPGLLLGIGLMVTCYVMARRNNFPREPWRGARELWSAFLDAFWALLMTALIIGGLLSGLVTPTETAIVACLYAIVVGLFIYRGLTLSSIVTIIIDSSVSAAGILVLVGFANVFGWILAAEQIPQAISSAVLAITDNQILIILMINLLLLIVGMFMETIAALIILFPPLLAVATASGIDPIHFATFAVLNLMIGLTTPPVGVCLFLCANIARVPLSKVVVAIVPFLLTNLFVLALVSYIPFLSTWLPNAVFGH